MDADHGLYVICDGMGGAAAGEVASHLACSTLIDVFTEHFGQLNTEDRLALSIRASNAAVRLAGEQTGQHGMGTTLVAAAVADNHLLVGNVGDSRAYLLQHDAWEQLTSDHSYINELIHQGSIRAEDRDAPELARFGSIITRAIGAAEDVQPDFFSVELHDGDTVLLASDGLTRYLDAPDFVRLIDPDDLEASCERLIDAAKKLGGIDNITCLLLRYIEHAE